MDTGRLLGLVKEHSLDLWFQVLTCAPDVEQVLQEHASPIRKDKDTTLISMMGIDVVIARDSAPGTWRLVRHDHCKTVVSWLDEEQTRIDLEKTYVSHQDCTILGISG